MKTFLVGTLILIAGLVGVGFLLPTEYRIEESITIDAPAAVVYPWIGDLERWSAWSPWEQEDETIVTTFGAETTGVGASQTWTSDSGDGELTLTRSDPGTGIAYDMAFLMEGKRAPAACAMDMSQSGEGTQVTWTMEGNVADFMPPVASGYMTLLMKSQISKMFVQGLGNLKRAVEAS